MTYLQRVWTALRSYPAPQPVTWETVFGSNTYTTTGVSVTEYSALNYSPVWSGVSTLSRDVAKLPLMFYRNLPNGGKEPFRDHKLYRILHDEWNPDMTSFKARETMQALCLLYGNSYAEIVRDELGRVAGMYPLLPSRVTPVRDDMSGRLRYRVTQARGGQVFIPPTNMLHLSSISTDGILGHSIVEHGRESFELGMATERFGGAFFGNGSTFGGTVEYPGILTEDTKTAIRSQLEAIHAGVERAHKVLVLAGGAKFTQRGTAPNEAQFIETRKFQINEVARWLTMPPHKLGDLENAHFTNIEEQEIQYYVGCVSGWLKMWEQELSRKLIPRLEYSQQSIEHNLEGVLRGDSTKRSDFYSKMFSIGAFSINDILRLENKNPIGPDGDMRLVPLNMVPIQRYDEMITAQIAAKGTPNDPKALGEGKTDEPAVVENEGERSDMKLTEFMDRLMVTAKSEREAERAQLLEELNAITTRMEAQRDNETATAKLAQAEAETRAVEALRQAVEARAQADTAIEAERAERVKQEQLAAAADAARIQAEQTAEAHFAEVKNAAAQVEAAVTRAVAAESRGDVTAQEKATADAAIATARQTLIEREATLLDAQRALETVQSDAAQASVKAGELAASLEARKNAELDRLTRVVTAYRTQIVDVVQRILKPEIDRARRKQLSPDTLRKWADAFYQTHVDVCADALYPVVLSPLAWKGSDDDPRTVAETLATEHCQDSLRQLNAVIDGSTPEDFHAELERLLLRWEQERPQKLADKVLQDEISFIRSYR